MALTPQNEDAFFREVDDELRREQLGTFWLRWGRLIAISVVVGLAAFGGFLWWQHQAREKAGLASEQFTQALVEVGQGPQQQAPAKAKLDALAADGNDAYRAVARLTLAAVALEKGDTKAAAEGYREIAADGKVAQPFRDLALIRQTAVEFDMLPPQQVVDRLKPLAEAGKPWFGSAAELVALAYIKQGKRDLAGPLLAAIAKDETVPLTIRSRTRRLATAMGVDAGPAPVAGQQAAGQQAAAGE